MTKPTWRSLVAVVALAAAATLTAAPAGAAVSPAPAPAAPQPPQNDPFMQPPAGYESTKPGTTLRSREASLALFSLFREKVDAWQVLYRTTGAQGQAMATAALVLVPRIPSPRKHRPLVSYHVAEDSLALKCAPSYQLQAGVPPENLVVQAEVLLINGLLKNGWTVVVPDYQGPKSAYGAGVQAGQLTLDSIRAAENFGPAKLNGSQTEIGMMGYSGGAIATGWAAELQPTYAPELNVKGVVEGGVPADLTIALKTLNGGIFGGYALAGALGAGRAYPELGELIDSILTPEGKDLAKRFGQSCNMMIVLQGFFKDIKKLTTIPEPFEHPIAKKVLADNKMGQHRPTAPMFVYHSVNDELVPVKPVDDLVKSYCAAGVRVSYQRDQLSEHIILVGTGAPLALAWLQDRMNGKPAASGCTTTTHTSMLANPLALKTLREYLTGIIPLF